MHHSKSRNNTLLVLIARYETSEETLAELELQSSREDRVYDKGEHAFSFVLIVPSSSAPFERCVHGRIFHTLEAVVQGEGRMGSNIEASVPIYLVANPAPVGETSDLNIRAEGFNERLGPYSIAIVARNLTVGGLLHFDARLAALPSRTQIVSVSTIIVAHYTINSNQRLSQPPQFATKATKLFVLDANNPPIPQTQVPTKIPPASTTRRDRKPEEPLTTVEPGESYQVMHLVRLPNDDTIRPSTPQGTKTPIDTRHELVLEIVFKNINEDHEAGKAAVLRTVHPITLSSCACMVPSLLVPAYTVDDTPPPLSKSPLTTTFWDIKCTDKCMCTVSMEDLVKEFRAAEERERTTHSQRALQASSRGVTTVVSWDDLNGDKFDYEPIGRA
ncbi:hypothetical protein DL93DRAFT_2083370 [Clavulina sp. PMI_390]|nr:hypothetical protein DL93DRAFT_2083370 [Clavulina sp. PMI_390]